MNWKLVFTGAILLASGLASAANSCRSTHQIFMQNIKRSLNTRSEVQIFFENRLRFVAQSQGHLEAKLIQQIFARGQAEEYLSQVGPRQVGGIKLNFSQIPKTPNPARETMDLLDAAYGAHSEMLDSAQRSELQAKAIAQLDKDPYFQWLFKNQTVDTQEMPGSSNPVDYLVSLMEMPGPLRLAPRTAFLQVFRDADPNVTAEQRRMIDDLLRMHQVGLSLRNDLMDLHSSEGSAGPLHAHGLAPSLIEAQKNLHELLEAQVQKHGNRFSRSAYERAGILTRQGDPAFVSLVTQQKKGVPADAQMSPDEKIQFSYVKKKLGLPDSLPNQELNRLMQALGESLMDHDGASYPTFLLRAFENPETSQAARQILQLKILVEYIEATKDEKLWVQMLNDHVRRLYRYWENP